LNALHYLNVSVTLSEVNCGECGGTYAINDQYRKQRQEDGGSWTCPYCKTGWGYNGDTEAEILLKKLKTQEKKNEWLKTDLIFANNRARAQKAAKTRLKNRINNGVCPCCKRTFNQLAMHMKTKHPDYAIKED